MTESEQWKQSTPRLDVLICTFGDEGLARIAGMNHPSADGVRYVVACQSPGKRPVIPDALMRDDFLIVASDSRGLSHNRNIAFAASAAPFLLIADDDIRYTPDAFSRIIETFDRHPGVGFLTFRSENSHNTKCYPETETPLRGKLPSGYYVTSFELALRRDIVVPAFRFNEYFGIGAIFPLGEENLFVDSMMRSGIEGCFIPHTICHHEGATTGNRIAADLSLISAQGAVVSRMYPASWFLRMLLFTMRNRKADGFPGCIRTMRAWLEGVRRSKALKSFSRPLAAKPTFIIIHPSAYDR